MRQNNDESNTREAEMLQETQSAAGAGDVGQKNPESKKKKTKKPRLNKNLRQLKHGSYSIALTVIVVVAVLIVNLIVGQLPSQYTQIDLSGQQLSVLTDTTKELIEGLDEDITIYYILEDSNRDTTVSRLLDRYADLSSHVTVVEKDPVLYPQFTSQYTDETLTDNSVIVVCGEQSRVISYDDMYEYEFSYTYYSYTTTGFDAEGQITSAIAALTSDSLPKLYTLTGHNELELPDDLITSIEKENIEVEELNLVTSDAVPDDADCLLICSPTSDISDAEVQKIINYLRRGGSAIIITDYTTTELTNLNTVLEYYGTELVDGIVIEGNSNYYVQVPYYLVPDINSTDVSDDMADGSAYVLLSAAQGIETTDDAREDLTISSVLTTSDNSYSKVDVQNMTTYEQEDDDIDGPFDLGVIITETVELTDELLEETAEVDEDTDLSSWLDELEIEEETETETEEDAEEAEDAETDDSADEDATEAEDTDDEAVDATEDEDVDDEAVDVTEAEDADVETDDSGDEDVTEAEDADNETDDSGDEDTTEVESETEEEEITTAEIRVAVFTSSTLVNESANSMVSGGNYQLFVNTLSWACDQESSVSVPSKSVSVEYLTLTSASSSFWSIVTIAIIPGALLIIGLGIWLGRRKR
ncbi:MAG: Gldg family protein [Lachnospiraceae bacterium]|nr:Gldg family protein [Lachnospiraceae bacterium]